MNSMHTQLRLSPEGFLFDAFTWKERIKMHRSERASPRYWKSDELGYCVSLVENGGDHHVPRDAVVDYLDVQIASAMRDLRMDVVRELRALKARWSST